MSRNINDGTKSTPLIDDLLLDSDDDDDEAGDLATQRNAMAQLVMESWRAIEVAALSIPDEQMRSIGSVRSIGSIRSGSMGTRRSSFASPANEKTRLLQEEAVKHRKIESPPIMKWIWIALLCAGSYALYNISIKKGSASINPIMGGVVLQFVAALLGTLLLSIMILHGKGHEIHYDRKGLLWSTGAGLWVGTAEMVSFVVSGMGVPATQFIPIIIGGSVLFGSILGVITLGETIMLHGWTGVTMLCIGIIMVATDPGEKVEEGGPAEADLDAAPPLAVWIVPALFCALAYALVSLDVLACFRTKRARSHHHGPSVQYLHQERISVDQSHRRCRHSAVRCCSIWLMYLVRPLYTWNATRA